MNIKQRAHTLQRVAPRGWTKEINSITSTPIYTNSRTGERWTLAKDGVGNYYYYNMSNPTLTVGELPEGTAASQDDHTESTENIYDSLDPLEVSCMCTNVLLLLMYMDLHVHFFVALKYMYMYIHVYFSCSSDL